MIVSDVEPEYLSEEFLEIYFCAQFGDGEDIVSSCRMSEKLEMAIVDFYGSKEGKKVRRILWAMVDLGCICVFTKCTHMFE